MVIPSTEIVRIRNEAPVNDPTVLADIPQPVEIFRHCATTAQSTADTPAPTPVSVAEVVRHKIPPLPQLEQVQK